jgi:formate-dependent nitrite reductase membrane component NrfD
MQVLELIKAGDWDGIKTGVDEIFSKGEAWVAKLEKKVENKGSYPLSIEYKEQKEWKALPMWTEMAIGAVAGGLFIVSAIMKFSQGLILALLAMLIGKGGLLLADLGKPTRFLKVLARPGQSWISKGAWGLIAGGGLGVAAVAPLILPGLPWTPWAGVGKILLLGAALGAAFMMVYDGLFLADSKGVAFWDNGVLPLVFGASAVLGGLGALAVLAPLGGLALPGLAFGWAQASAAVVAGFAVFSLLIASKEGGAAQGAEKLLQGELSQIFQVGALALGIGAPLALGGLAITGAAVPGVCWATAGLAEIVGVVALRYSILRAGVYSPVL